MNNLLKFIILSSIFSSFFFENSIAQLRKSASVDIKVNIVNSISPIILQENNIDKLSKASSSKDSDREILVQISNLENNRILQSNNDILKNDFKIYKNSNINVAQAYIGDEITIKNLDKTENLQFIPSKIAENQDIWKKTAITIVY